MSELLKAFTAQEQIITLQNEVIKDLFMIVAEHVELDDLEKYGFASKIDTIRNMTDALYKY